MYIRLLNGVSVAQERPDTVTYVHVELTAHALLLAGGAAAESYLDEGCRAFFTADASLPGSWRDRTRAACAPYASDDAFSELVWRRVAGRAQAVTPAPRLRTEVTVLAGGRHLRPATVQGDRRFYALPRGTEEVRPLSPAACTTNSRPWAEDRRRLGVRLPLDGPLVRRGWWAAEPDGRWTAGDDRLALPAAATLELRMTL